MSALSNGSDDRRARLLYMKLVATALLLLATAMFVICVTVAADAGTWVGYVRAAAEASMVGALADWFAVTALFRHPLGLPIPHTAIIPRKKDQIGASLGGFVRDHFLTREVVDARFNELDVPGQLSAFLASPGRAERLASDLTVALRGATQMAEDELVQTKLADAIKSRLQNLRAAATLADLLESLIYDAHRRESFGDACQQAADLMNKYRDPLRKLLAKKSPVWVPKFIDSKVFDEYLKLMEYLKRVADESSGERDKLEKEMLNLAKRLRNDPATIERVEKAKSDLLENKHIREISAALWQTIKSAANSAAEDPGSEVRVRLVAFIEFAAARLATDPTLRELVQRESRQAAGYIVERLADDVAELVGKTIARWDSSETSRILELQIGRDLQFIRINGTIVGGVAGLLIYTFAQFL